MKCHIVDRYLMALTMIFYTYRSYRKLCYSISRIVSKTKKSYGEVNQLNDNSMVSLEPSHYKEATVAGCYDIYAHA